MKSTKTTLALLAALALLFAACSSDDEASTDDAAVDETTTEEEVAEEEVPEEAATETEEAVAEQEPVEAAGTSIAVELNEWDLIMAAEVPTGPVTYAVSNTGDFNHRLAVVKGASYEELPLLDNGAIDTDALGADFIGEQEVNLESGQSGEVTWDLPAGDYVFFCPIAVGPNSHAGAGQVASVTVG